MAQLILHLFSELGVGTVGMDIWEGVLLWLLGPGALGRAGALQPSESLTRSQVLGAAESRQALPEAGPCIYLHIGTPQYRGCALFQSSAFRIAHVTNSRVI